ncbi:FKBP-type peptidyl-prolyl cis-trans isomerase [Oceanospirillum sediminis]|uniref:Peptidyl-prolyl cis-trans isomerase n=1 Tax=Oceanospirillum sediminis TaxID=2760088 RepID=A0A839IS81_9GAMM|nr:peptidylprolyl isomerase [Oceanospirillum sediminis]MBB1487412.1 peptidylprolyl isomerase [Oceanospirillum sediminis]
MQITDNTVVQFFYTLKDEEGQVLESNIGENPVAYLHGHKNMMPGVEKALADRQSGESFTVTLPPESTYGARVEGREQRIPVKHLMGTNKKWKPGMIAMVQTDQGQRQVTILKMGKFMVTVDTNHPWAGKTLTFDIEVGDVREATAEELSHGHAHGVGGHHH